MKITDVKLRFAKHYLLSLIHISGSLAWKHGRRRRSPGAFLHLSSRRTAFFPLLYSCLLYTSLSAMQLLYLIIGTK